MNPIDLDQRLSVPALQLGEPGPDAGQLQQLLQSALRVPDHGKLVPWRMLLVRGEARARLGEALAAIHPRSDPGVAPAKVEKNRERFRHSPLVIVVTAADLTEDDRRRLNGGVLHVLQKAAATRDQLLGELRELVAQCLAQDVQLEGADDA